MSDKQWSIWIDIEGFSATYHSDRVKAKNNLGALMEALYQIGNSIFSISSDSLFIYQFGDGFVIVPYFPELKPDRPLAICIAVMRHLLSKNITTKAAVSAGDFADIQGCYPKKVMNNVQDGFSMKLGGGVMTIMPVMGTALISAHELANCGSGALLLINTPAFAAIPHGVLLKTYEFSSIDWIHSNFPLVDNICKEAELETLSSSEAETKIREYLDNNKNSLSNRWIESTISSLGLEKNQ